MAHYELHPRPIQLQDLVNALQSKLLLSEAAKTKIRNNRHYLEQKIERHPKPIYGINTGFGSLCDTQISPQQLNDLQRNLVVSHACGVGERVPLEVVKIMLFLKIQNMVYGHSGVRLAVVERLVWHYNQGFFPEVFQQGSLGASGDLAPLAHLSLPLLGLGKVWNGTTYVETKSLLATTEMEPLTLEAKEGLALLNGTQFMTGYASHILLKMRKLTDWSLLIASSSLDAFHGLLDAFVPYVHEVRKQPKQVWVAERVNSILEGSDLMRHEKSHVQDPYSFRCIPQVHGASLQWIQYVTEVVENEMSSVTDNPTVFEEEDQVISAGNFHGQPIALALDFLAVAIAELASISERRIYKLISGQRGLPAFLVKEPGLNSGFMIPQYTAASVVSQNKQLCTPASVDTIDSSNGQEDHVSMGANAATKCHQVVKNLQKVLGIELLTAFQALDFRKPITSSPRIEKVKAAYRKEIPFVESDTVMHDLIQKSIDWLDRKP